MSHIESRMDRVEAASIGHDRRAVKAALARSGVDLAAFATATTGWHLLRYFITCYATAAVGAYFFVEWGALAGVLVWGVAQHAMLNVVHEASHYSLSRRRKLNDFIGNILFAVPIGLTVQRYRAVHEDHHKQLATDGDPSGFLIDPAVTNRQMLKSLLFLLAGRVVFDLIAGLRGQKNKKDATVAADRARLLMLIGFHVPLFCALLYFGYWQMHVVWVMTAATFTPFLDGVRTIAEHRFGDEHDGHTRSHHTNAVVSAIFAPFFQYHWEHHLFPSIPHSKLPRFHQTLIDLDIAPARPVRGGFFGALLTGLRK